MTIIKQRCCSFVFLQGERSFAECSGILQGVWMPIRVSNEPKDKMLSVVDEDMNNMKLTELSVSVSRTLWNEASLPSPLQSILSQPSF